MTVRHRLGCTLSVLVLPLVLRHVRRCRWCAELYWRLTGDSWLLHSIDHPAFLTEPAPAPVPGDGLRDGKA